MKKYAIAIITLCLPILAYAQPYVAVQSGLSLLPDADIHQDGNTSTATFDPGFNVAFRAGATLHQNWRLEGEISFNDNSVDKFEAGGFSVDADGEEYALSFLANGIYDFTPNQPFHPYIGVGIGFSDLRIHDFKVPAVRRLTGLNAKLADDTNDLVFAYQAMAGVEFDITPKAALYAEYHYLGTTDPTFKDTTGAEFDSEYASHNISIGFRYFL